MATQSNKSLFSWIVVTMLAWLGLAGLSDAIVEWQTWFEQGLMQHWRSVKEWVIAILLWWVPFRVPSWLIDYFVVATIVVRTSESPKWNERWRFGPEDALEVYGYIPLTLKLEWLMSHTFTPHRLPAIAVFFIFWPFLLLLAMVEAIRGKAFAPEVKISASEKRRKTVAWFSRMAWCFVGFLPILFVCSTVLYQHG